MNDKNDDTIAKEWLRYADNDLIVAKHSFHDLHPKQTEIACYLSQQCAEKSLKSILVHHNTEPPRTHDLIALCEMCIKQDNDFIALRENCKILTAYGVHVRYPNELAVDEGITKIAIDQAQLVYDFCISKIDKSNKLEKPEKL
ncbi:nucleotidyltransferase [Spirochaetia bacterium]|nr:nucleotidyltransferase [Spirochaetia bacterium]